MAKTKPSCPKVCGPLSEFVPGFSAELVRLGYTPLTAAGLLRLMAHLSRWMTRRRLDAAALDEATVATYFSHRRAAGYANELTPRSLRPLLGYLRQLGVLAPPAPGEPASPLEVLLKQYRDWLRHERGLTETTVELNSRLVRPFLLAHLADGGEAVAVAELTAQDVADYVLTQARHRPGSVKRTVTALRSVLTFLHVQGELAVPLAAAAPKVANWTQAGLPKALTVDQLKALLGSFDRATPTGRRDLAICTMLSRLGLRAGEVAGLGLDDIDWRAGEVCIRGKGNRHDRLPLPADVGAAIVDYLRRDRPANALARTVFVRAQAPYRGLSSAGVTTVVAAAGRRAGLGTIGAHRLRHTAATAMLRAGGSLTEIGQLLRHRRVSTTAIYAKVDVAALRTLARPWPGASS